MNTDGLFKNYRAMRFYAWDVVKDLTDAQMNVIPPGAVNNMLWNLGHVIADECNMLYTPSGLPSPLPPEYTGLFDPETSPRGWAEPPKVQEVREQAQALGKRVEGDYKAGVFRRFEAYALGESFRLNTIEEAIAYCALHESMHIGVNITLKRIVTGKSTTH